MTRSVSNVNLTSVHLTWIHPDCSRHLSVWLLHPPSRPWTSNTDDFHKVDRTSEGIVNGQRREVLRSSLPPCTWVLGGLITKSETTRILSDFSLNILWLRVRDEVKWVWPGETGSREVRQDWDGVRSKTLVDDTWLWCGNVTYIRLHTVNLTNDTKKGPHTLP